MTGKATRIGLVTGVLAVLIGTGAADPAGPGPTGVSAGETIMPPPPMFQGTAANVTEHLGGKLPLDATFKTHEGKQVTLREIVTGDLPTILTFNYADCPMLCSQQLNGLTAAMPAAAKRGPIPGSADPLSFALGEHYRIVTISLEPNESLVKINNMRTKYLDRIGAKQDARWTFLVGDSASIQRVADAVGFGYAYVPERAEWAHPAAFTFLSSAGVITRYVYGIEFSGTVLAESIYKAGLAEPSTATGFMLRCYHWDPSASDHSRVGVLALRVGAASAVAILAVFGILLARRHKPRREVT